MHYVRDRASEHVTLMILGLPRMLDWLQARFEGREAPTGTDTVASVALSPRAWFGFLRMLGAVAKTVVGSAR